MSLSPYDYFEQTSDRDERVICYIVNSAEYCHKTVGFWIRGTSCWFLNFSLIYAWLLVRRE